MIQYWLKEQLTTIAAGMRLTVDFEPDAETYVTVFYEGGGAPDRYDFNIRRPNYMVWIQSTDWGQAEMIAHDVFNALHKFHRDHPATDIPVEYYKNGVLIKTETFALQNIFAVGEPNPLGVDNGKMQYSVNFTATLLKKGEI